MAALAAFLACGVAAPAHAKFKCGVPSKCTVPAVIATAQAAVEDSCPCDEATSAKAYKRCATPVVKQLAKELGSAAFPKACQHDVKKALANSLCGRADDVLCRSVGKKSTVVCKVTAASKCADPFPASSACGASLTCADACDPPECTTTTTSPTSSSTVTTTSTTVTTSTSIVTTSSTVATTSSTVGTTSTSTVPTTTTTTTTSSTTSSTPATTTTTTTLASTSTSITIVTTTTTTTAPPSTSTSTTITTSTTTTTLPFPPETNCSNGADDDGDTLTDCADPDCAWACAELNCGGGQELRVFQSTDLPQPIADLTTTQSAIVVTAGGTVTDVAMRVTLLHSFDADIDLSLIPPGGISHELSTDNGGGGDNYVATVFRDSAATAITAGSAPFTGSFTPEVGFGTYVTGASVTGIWKASVFDDFAGDSGTFSAFALAFCVQPSPETRCSDGADDDEDGATDCADADCAWACSELACGAGEDLRVFRASDLPQPIADLSSTFSSITIPTPGTVGSVAMRVGVTHTFDADIDLSLTPPGGSAHDVSSDNGGAGDDYVNTVFRDSAATAVTAGAAPFTGSFKPEVTFASYVDGTNLAGTWTAALADDAAGDVGFWNHFSLGFCVAPSGETQCSDGADDDDDGLTDCADADCAWACAELACGNGTRLVVHRATSLPSPITDLTTTFSSIPVTDTGTIAQAAMRIDATHTFDADIDLTLTPPGGSAHDVSTDNGGGGDDYAGTVFRDTAATPVILGSAPFAGSFRPEVAFSTYIDGTSPAGTWTAALADDATNDTGTWNALALAFCLAP